MGGKTELISHPPYIYSLKKKKDKTVSGKKSEITQCLNKEQNTLNNAHIAGDQTLDLQPTEMNNTRGEGEYSLRTET